MISKKILHLLLLVVILYLSYYLYTLTKPIENFDETESESKHRLSLEYQF